MDQGILYLATRMPNKRRALELINDSEAEGDDVFHVVKRGDRQTKAVHFVASSGLCVLAEEETDTFLRTDVCRKPAPMAFSRALGTVDEDEANAFVLVSGAAKFFRSYPNMHTDFRRRLECERDCFVVWGNEKGEPFADLDVRAESGQYDGSSVQLHAVSERVVKGVVFFRECIFDDYANPSYLTRFVQILCKWKKEAVEVDEEFAIDVADFNMITFEKVRSDGFYDRDLASFAGWRRLVEPAVAGFRATCKVNEVLPESRRVQTNGTPSAESETVSNMERFVATVADMPAADALAVVETVEELCELAKIHREENATLIESVYRILGLPTVGDDLMDRLFPIAEQLEEQYT